MNENFKSLFFENRGLRQTLLKNTFWLTFSKITSKILIAILGILIARYLGAKEFGELSFVFAFVLLFSIIADFGLITLTIREIARNTSLAKKYINNIVIIKVILGSIAFGMIILVSNLLHKTTEIKTLIYLAAAWMIIQSFVQFFQSIFRAFEKMEYEALSKIIYSAVLFALIIYGIHLSWGIKALMQSYVLAAAIGLIVVLFLIWIKFIKFRIEVDLLFWKKLLNEAWPFALFTVFAIMYFQISVVMLSLMDTDRAVGLYSIAFNSVVVFLILADIVASSVLPTLSKLINRNNLFKRLIRKLIILLLITGLSLAIILFLGAPFLIKLIYGIEFVEATRAFQVMVWILPLRFMNYIFAVFLIVMNLQKKRLNAAIICALFNVLINLILIPVFGFMGAAVSTLLTEITLFFIYFAFYRKTLNKITTTQFNG